MVRGTRRPGVARRKRAWADKTFVLNLAANVPQSVDLLVDYRALTGTTAGCTVAAIRGTFNWFSGTTVNRADAVHIGLRVDDRARVGADIDPHNVSRSHLDWMFNVEYFASLLGLVGGDLPVGVSGEFYNKSMRKMDEVQETLLLVANPVASAATTFTCHTRVLLLLP